ncbi:MAG: NusG domain II-containing protein [Christensenellales bacterium]
MWLLLAAVLLSVAAVFLWSIRKASGTMVEVYLGDTLYTTCPLEENLLLIDQGDGKINCIRITAEGVEMESASCVGQDCVHQGVLKPGGSVSMGNWIVCLPNGVSVRLAEAE